MSAKRILMVHNYYQQPGGEDQIFATESGLLESRGHPVSRYSVHNDSVKEMSRLATAAAAVWNRPIQDDLRAAIRKERPDVIHFHNTFPLISPAAYYTARAEGVPIVQNIQNYRLLCPNAVFYRNGHVCEDCLSKTIPWPGIVHACYRDSRAGSAAVGLMLSTHRLLRTWTKMVDAYVVPTEFLRQKLIQGGLPANNILVKPNFVFPDPGLGAHQGGFALFAGRLVVEKGIKTLLRAWERLDIPLPLKIAGDGPLAGYVASVVAKTNRRIEWLGRQTKEEVLALMRDAMLMVVPSEWYEGSPMVIAEGFAVGVPLIASNLGGIASVIQNKRTGFLFKPGDAADLKAKVEWAWAHPENLTAVGQAARREFEVKYTADRNYEMLMEIYDQVTARARERSPSRRRKSG